MQKTLIIAALLLAGCDKGLQTAMPGESAKPETAISSQASGAAPRAYEGNWAQNPAQCKIPQEQQDAPMILTATGYDQHETHCTFSKAEETAPGIWKIEQSCSVEGDQQNRVLELQVEDDTLTLSPGKNAAQLIRCPVG